MNQETRESMKKNEKIGEGQEEEGVDQERIEEETLENAEDQ